MPKLFDLKRKILTDLKVELLDEFDRNFQRRAFFDRPWPGRKSPGNGDKLLNDTGYGRNSIRGTIRQNGVEFSTDTPYMGCTTGAERSRSHPGCGNTFGTCIAKMPKALPTQSRSVRPTIPSVIECSQRRRSSGKIWL